MNTEVSKINRFVALFIDSLIAGIPSFIFGFIAGLTKIHALIFVGYIIALAYYLLRDALFGGQSIGKKVMKYKAVNNGGSSLAGDYKTSALRNVSLIIPIISLLDCIWVITDKPRFGDTWANTKVVNE
ncbi:RDD family protein [Chitinophagaceae bacterium LWZ2-11]